MTCEGCGARSVVLKTCRWRAGAVWIVPGPHVVFGVCRGCGGWFSLRDLFEGTGGGGKWGSSTGVCQDCA
jgi:hypothetical protein